MKKTFSYVIFIVSLIVFAAGGYRAVSYLTWQMSRFFVSEQLVCEKQEHDFGVVQKGDQPEFTFVFKNIGKTSCTIHRVIPGCSSCVNIIDFPKEPILPDSSASVRVALLTDGLEGSVKKAVLVKSDDQALLVLYLLADVIHNNTE